MPAARGEIPRRTESGEAPRHPVPGATGAYWVYSTEEQRRQTVCIAARMRRGLSLRAAGMGKARKQQMLVMVAPRTRTNAILPLDANQVPLTGRGTCETVQRIVNSACRRRIWMSMRSILRLVVLGLAAVILFADSIPGVAAQEEEPHIQGWCSGYFSFRGTGCEGNDGWDWWPRRWHIIRCCSGDRCTDFGWPTFRCCS